MTDEFVMLPGRTRENVTIVERAGGRDTHIRDVGLPVGRPELARLADKLRLLCTPGAILVFSGSLPPGVEPGDLACMVEKGLAAGARVAVDTSGAALRAAVGSRLWLVKPNTRELAEIAGRDLDALDEQLAAARELSRRAETVLLSRGDGGAYLFAPGLALHAGLGGERDEAANTVGCGDVLLGAFLAGIMAGEGVPAALRNAVATASASARHPVTAAFDPDLVEKLIGRVEVDEL